MKILLYPFFLLSFFGALSAQTLSTQILPSKVRKALKDFVAIEGETYDQGLFNGSDSLQCSLPKPVTVKSFYLNRFEVSVAEYQEFLRETGDMSNLYDSTVWTKDFPSAYHQPVERSYFMHPNFKECPIVGISCKQALQYCVWKTDQLNQWMGNAPYRITVRLPNASEWEYAARGLVPEEDYSNNKRQRRHIRVYPWDGFFLIAEKDGHFYTNCNGGQIMTADKVPILAHPSDGFLYTAPVKSFLPNDFGLYQMAGNVSEWTSDDYATLRERYDIFLDEHEDGQNVPPGVLDQLNALAPGAQLRDYKIVKGGSWADGAFYMQIGVCKIQPPGKASCTTGFRVALTVDPK